MNHYLIAMVMDSRKVDVRDPDLMDGSHMDTKRVYLIHQNIGQMYHRNQTEQILGKM